MDSPWSFKLTRLDFLKALGLAGAGAALPGGAAFAKTNDPFRTPGSSNKTMKGVPFEAKDRPRIAIIGVGGRGTSLLGDFLGTGNVDVAAVCDVVPAKVANAQRIAVRAGQKEPAGYSKGDHDYENLLQRDDIDIAITATPWDWHVPISVFAMEQGKHAFTEVPAAKTIDDCWKLVDTSERTRRHCVMMENCCYGENEMTILNMIRQGLFGDLTHGEAAYIHDLRSELFSNAGEGLWRRFEHLHRNGNIYPTHGLGPVAKYINIHNGDRFEYLVSASSPERNLSRWRNDHTKPGEPKNAERYACGDMNTSIIKTANGLTVMLQHDVVGPRPYDRLNLISGTLATFRDYPARIFQDGQKVDDWQAFDDFLVKYQHPFWKEVGELAKKNGGHGGMDFVMAWRLIECVRQGIAPDMDVYDAAAWSAPSPLSEWSVAHGSAPAKFPDFTRGKWKG
jgi:hypothetical protein